MYSTLTENCRNVVESSEPGCNKVINTVGNTRIYNVQIAMGDWNRIVWISADEVKSQRRHGLFSSNKGELLGQIIWQRNDLIFKFKYVYSNDLILRDFRVYWCSRLSSIQMHIFFLWNLIWRNYQHASRYEIYVRQSNICTFVALHVERMSNVDYFYDCNGQI